ncbi:MAG: PilZ domain-containing protein [Acidobacteriaceae bacterium]|nr:PilZ domain-containing protein [Acidobacteriaceae bacterium]
MRVQATLDETVGNPPESHTLNAERVVIRFPIEVWGTDLLGHDFNEVSRTESITRRGATIVLKRLLGPQNTIRLLQAGKKTEALARVVGQTGILPDGNVYGVRLEDSDDQFWAITFPPLTECRKAVSRVLLQCRSCKSREVVYLDEIESEVFETNNWLSRSCTQCSDWTRWFLAPRDVKPGEESTMTLPDKAKAPEAAADKRKHRRLKMQTNGCIREPGEEENIVAVVDVSRGGVKFRTLKKYSTHKWVEIAVPYTRGAANIFVPARITWTKYGRPGDWNEYGLAYAKQSKEQLLEELSQVRSKSDER